MKIYNNEQEVKKDLIDWILKVDGDIKFTFNLRMDIDIIANNIIAEIIKDFHVNNIKCEKIIAGEIKCKNIISNDISSPYIIADFIKSNKVESNDVECKKIKADKIDVYSIYSYHIDVNEIIYYGECIAYKTFKCKSIKWMKENSKHFCIKWEIEITW